MTRPDPALADPLVLIDGHMLGRGETGNETYMAGLLHGLAKIGAPQAVAVDRAVAEAAAEAPGVGPATRPQPSASAGHSCLRGHRVLALPGGSDAQRLLRDLPRLASSVGASVLHTTYFPPPVLRCASVVTVHDVSFLRHPEWFTARDGAVLHTGVRLAARTAERLVVPSEHARREVMELLHVAGERVVVTPEAAGPQFRPVDEAVARATTAGLGIDGPYVLAVGNLQPRKNLRRLLVAWRGLVAAGEHHDCRLVLAGGLHGREEQLADLLADPHLARSVITTGYLPHEQLPALYSGAQAFVLPSLYEGFGLPILEAMACAAPVACSNAASLPEVAGDAAALFDPTDTDAIASALAALLGDARLRATLRERGLSRARDFTWAACARATLEAYRQAAELRPPRRRPGRRQPSARRTDRRYSAARPENALDISGERVTSHGETSPTASGQSTGRDLTRRPLRIALLGTRGVPAAYSGFETAVENLGERLAARGHDVVVYCRPHMVEGRHDVYKGMHLVYLPTIASKHLDTFVHSFLSTLHMGFLRRRDAAVYFIAGNAPFAGLSRLLGIPSAINVDGLDSRRAKWGGPARRYIRWAEHNAPRLANTVITDSRVLQRIYREEHHAETLFIPYGADMEEPAEQAAIVTTDPQRASSHEPAEEAEAAAEAAGKPPAVPDGFPAAASAPSAAADESRETPDALARFDLRPGGYLLFVGRLVPENNAHVLLEAYSSLETDLDLVIVGDAPYATEYIADLRERGARIEQERAAKVEQAGRESSATTGLDGTARTDGQRSGRVVFTGYLFGPGYRELARSCAVFCIPTEVGGTHPVLVEAMAAGACVVVNDHEPNMEVLGDAGESYRGSDGAPALRAVLDRLLADPARMEDLRGRARERAARLYSWDAVTDQYEQLALHLANRV